MKDLAPFFIRTSTGFGGDNFFQRFALLFECSNFVADFNQHVPEKNQVGFSAYGPVPGNDDHLVSHFGYVCFGCADLPVDAASG